MKKYFVVHFITPYKDHWEAGFIDETMEEEELQEIISDEFSNYLGKIVETYHNSFFDENDDPIEDTIQDFLQSSFFCWDWTTRERLECSGIDEIEEW